MAHKKHPVFRLLFTIVSAISLLLFLASIVVWVHNAMTLSAMPVWLTHSDEWTFTSEYIMQVNEDAEELELPYWVPLIAFAILPTIWFFTRHVSRATARGFPVLPNPKP